MCAAVPMVTSPNLFRGRSAPATKAVGTHAEEPIFGAQGHVFGPVEIYSPALALSDFSVPFSRAVHPGFKEHTWVRAFLERTSSITSRTTQGPSKLLLNIEPNNPDVETRVVGEPHV